MFKCRGYHFWQPPYVQGIPCKMQPKLQHTSLSGYTLLYVSCTAANNLMTSHSFTNGLLFLAVYSFLQHLQWDHIVNWCVMHHFPIIWPPLALLWTYATLHKHESYNVRPHTLLQVLLFFCISVFVICKQLWYVYLVSTVKLISYYL